MEWFYNMLLEVTNEPYICAVATAVAAVFCVVFLLRAIFGLFIKR